MVVVGKGGNTHVFNPSTPPPPSPPQDPCMQLTGRHVWLGGRQRKRETKKPDGILVRQPLTAW